MSFKILVFPGWTWRNSQFRTPSAPLRIVTIPGYTIGWSYAHISIIYFPSRDQAFFSSLFYCDPLPVSQYSVRNNRYFPRKIPMKRLYYTLPGFSCRFLRIKSPVEKARIFCTIRYTHHKTVGILNWRQSRTTQNWCFFAAQFIFFWYNFQPCGNHWPYLETKWSCLKWYYLARWVHPISLVI
jgi:hypothetical protein